MLHPSLWVPGWAFTVPRCRCLSPLPPPLPHAAVMVTFELGMIGLARTLQPVPQQVQAWGPPPSAFYPPPGAYYPPPFPYGPWPVQQVGDMPAVCACMGQYMGCMMLQLLLVCMRYTLRARRCLRPECPNQETAAAPQPAQPAPLQARPGRHRFGG